MNIRTSKTGKITITLEAVSARELLQELQMISWQDEDELINELYEKLASANLKDPAPLQSRTFAATKWSERIALTVGQEIQVREPGSSAWVDGEVVELFPESNNLITSFTKRDGTHVERAYTMIWDVEAD